MRTAYPLGFSALSDAEQRCKVRCAYSPDACDLHG